MDFFKVEVPSPADEMSMDGDCKATKNPWAVDNLDEYLFYCCPQCDHRAATKHSFIHHALVNHEEAKDCLGDANSEIETNNQGLDQGFACNKEEIEVKVEPLGDDLIDVDDFDPDAFDDDKDVAEDSGRKRGKFQCYFCGSEYAMRQSLVKHMRKLHKKFSSAMSGPPRPCCHKCGFAFADSADWRADHACASSKPKKAKPRVVLSEYQCYKCGSIVQTEDQAVDHFKTHHPSFKVHPNHYGPPRPVQCHNCKRMFESAAGHDCHVCDSGFRKVRGQPYECLVCGMTCPELVSMRRHVATVHTVQTPFECDRCDFKTKTAVDLKQHKKNHHEARQDHVCHVCGGSFTSTYTLRDHILNMHGGARDHICDKCGQGFPSVKSLHSHAYKFHVFHTMCTLCERISRSLRLHCKHLTAKHDILIPDVVNAAVCVECRAYYTSAAELSDHMVRDHASTDLLACPQCPEAFAGRLVRKLHMVNAHAPTTYGLTESERAAWDRILNFDAAVQTPSRREKKKGFPCDTCGKVLSCPGSLKEHIRQVHDKSNHVKCEHCNYTTFQPAMMRRHFKNTHDVANMKQCPHCPYKTVSKSVMRTHVQKLHTRVVKFNCSTCGEGFVTKKDLTSHMFDIHQSV